MSSADQVSTINNLDQQEGAPAATTEAVSDFERLAHYYCEDPVPGDDTIGGMLDSRAP